MNTIPDPILSPDERIDTVNEQIRLIQKRNGLTFGTDAFLLAAFIGCMSKAHAVDLGSGTGIISLLLLTKGKIKDVRAVEIQSAFADLIRRNAVLNGMEDRLSVLECDLRNLPCSDSIQLVFANPPYLSADCGRCSPFLEKEIARHEIHGGIRDFCAAASRLLQTKGKFACVWRPERLPELFSAMREFRLEPKRMVTVYPDVRSTPCLVLVEAVKDALPGMVSLPPLFLYLPENNCTSKRTLTETAQAIYDTCSFEFLTDSKKTS